MTEGNTVIVTRNEVAHARRNPGYCILGVVSKLELDDNGDIDPTSGELWVGPFDPDAGELDAIAFDFTPSWGTFNQHLE